METAKEIKGAHRSSPSHWTPETEKNGEKGRNIVDHSDSPNGLLDLMFTSMSLFVQ
jgi:hypothetical protein